MLLAGLYESTWLKDQTKPLWSFTIVTTEANEDFMWLHDRQPVILSTKEAVDTWLDTSSQEWSSELAGLVGPYKDTSAPLQCYQVPLEVGKVGKESPSFIEPVENRKDGIEALFSKQKAKGAVVPQTPQKGKRKRSMSSEATLDDEAIIIIDDGNEGIDQTTPKKKGRLPDEGKAESSGGAGQSQDETTKTEAQLSLTNLPCTPTKPKRRPTRTPSPKKPRTSPVKPYSPTKPKPAKGHGSAKITSFFNKAT
ncbi:hypothetical protein ONZ45_g8539 [Pleurotus djamor]|nr:hypothetical protein ONZ45_g8539 [Pleurotus djamor]